MTFPQPQRRRYTLIGLAFQYISMGLSIAQGIVLVPLFLKHLSLPIYGAWLAMSSAVVWLSLLDPGVSGVFQQRIGAAYGKGDKEGVESAIGTGVAVNILVYAVLVGAAAAIGPMLPGFLHISGEQSVLLVKCFLLKAVAEAMLAMAMTVISVPMALMAYPITVGTIYCALTLLGMVVTAVLLGAGWGLLALPVGSLVRGGGLLIANAVITAVLCRGKHELSPQATAGELRAIAGLTGFSWLARVGEGMTGEADAFLIGHFLGPATVPILTMTRNAADIIQQLASRVASAFLPALTHLHAARASGGSQAVTMRLLRFVCWTAAFGAGGYVALNERFMTVWVGPGYFGGMKLTLLFGLLLVSQACARSTSRILFGFGKIRETSLIAVAEAAARVGALCLLLGAGVGMLSAPIAGILAIAMTGGWRLPRLLDLELRLSAAHARAAVLEILTTVGVCMAIGGAWDAFAPPVLGWTDFLGQGLTFSVLAIAGLAVVSRESRKEAIAALKGIPAAQGLNARFKAWRLRARDAAIEQHYLSLAASRGIRYDADEAVKQLKAGLRRRSPLKRRPVVLWFGANWNQDNSGFLAALRRQASVYCFYNSRGEYGPIMFLGEGRADLYDARVVKNNSAALERAYAECVAKFGKPDLLLGQMWGHYVSSEALIRIRSEGVPVVNISMDDRLPEHWEKRNGFRTGPVSLIPGMDLILTTSPEACLRYAVEGCPALYWPLGSDPNLFEALPESERVHDVMFIGNKYGIRAKIIEALTAAGISVSAYGQGWPNGPVPPEKAAPLFSRSKIVLGIGTIAHNEDRFTLKLRDFDGPMSGALYLTHRNPDLLQFYAEGSEIVCYRSVEECVRQAKRFLGDRASRERIARAGAEKCRRLYTWDRWVNSLFQLLEIAPRTPA